MRVIIGLCILGALLFTGVSVQADLLNAGFETNSGGGGSADWWSDSGAAGTEGWANHSGSWGMAAVGWSSNFASFHQDAAGTADREYTFSIWINKDASFEAGAVDLMLEWYDSGSLLLGSATNSVYSSLNDTWQQFNLVATSPTDTATVRAKLDVTDITAGGAAKFDDADLDVTAIPEPATMAFILLGMGLVAIRLKQKRNY